MSVIWRLVSAGLVFAFASSCTRTPQAPVTCAAGVSDIYPTSAELPENILRFYVYFDTPMRPETVWPAISLVNGAGKKIDGVFLANNNDLWSPDRKRLTLLLDPGRVKTGLDASTSMGRAITEGGQYGLVVGTDAISNQGCPLKQPYIKSFIATASDQSVPAPLEWVNETPHAGRRDPLKLHLNDIHDHVSLAYRLRVKTLAGAAVPGRIDLAAFETEWHFTPQANWQLGDYVIAVDPTLEDVAGNRPTGLFDDPTGQGRLNQADASTIFISFSTQPAEQEVPPE
ncbi:MAG: hypothetical protein AAF829_01675 [Pseudomonadota bacterium]